MEQGSFSRGSTGTATILLEGSFIPNYFEFDIGPRASTNETHVIRSSGWQDLANARKATISNFSDGSVRATRETTSYGITHYKNVSGTLTKVISGSVTSASLGEFEVNFDTVDVNYIIRFRAFV